MRDGLVQVYTGEGKGKTSASLGLALRAIGHNHSVYIIQFMKSGDTGEMFSIQRYLPHVKFIQFGRNAIKEKQMKVFSYEDEEKTENTLTEKERYIFLSDKAETEPSEQGIDFASRIIRSGDYDVVILDEINCVLSKDMVHTKKILELIKDKPKHVELILTGRDAPQEIQDAADLVSEIKKLKHPYDKGILARKGIEY